MDRTTRRGLLRRNTRGEKMDRKKIVTNHYEQDYLCPKCEAAQKSTDRHKLNEYKCPQCGEFHVHKVFIFGSPMDYDCKKQK